MDEINEQEVIEEIIEVVEAEESKTPGFIGRVKKKHGKTIMKVVKGTLVVVGMGLAFALGKSSNDEDGTYLPYDEAGDDDAADYEYDVDASVEDGSEA